MTTPPATPTGGQEGPPAPLLACLDEYRRAAAEVRRSLEARAQARAALDAAQDAQQDARARAEVQHAEQPRDRRALLVAAEVYALELVARRARDCFRQADDWAERARVTERAAREELNVWRVLAQLPEVLT